MPFELSVPFNVSTYDGRNFTLLEDVVYVDATGARYKLPIGATSDGASTPPRLWSQFDLEWLPPFGSYWRAAFLHDCAYRNTLQIEVKGKWVQASLPKNRCDDLLKECMESLGTHKLTTDEIYEGVVTFGESSFDKDRAAPPV